MPHEKPTDVALWSGGHDVSGPVTLGFETALVIGNLFPICVACCTKRGRNRIPTDELIVALSITDIISVVVPGPLGWIAYFTHQWYGGKHTCQFYQVCVTWFQLTSMCLITFMTFDRWMSLKDALAYKATPSGNNCRVRISVFLIYMFTLAVSCLPLTGLAPRGISSSGKSCQSWLLAQPKNTLEHVFHFVYLTVGYSNLLTTVLVNGTVMATLWKFKKKFGSKQAERMSSAALQIDRRSVVEFTVMILIVTLVFYLAWLPTLTLLTLLQFSVPVSDSVILYCLLSTTLTGLLNPVVYGIFSRTYRRGYHKIITSASRFIFGCPLTEQDMLKSLSPHGRHMKAAGSTSNSLAGLLSRSSDTTDVDYASHSHLPQHNDHKDSLLGGGDGGLTFTRCDLHARRMRAMGGGHDHDHDCAISGELSVANANYDFDPHDKACMEELLEKDETEVAKEIYGSRLSLISEESEDHLAEAPETSYRVATTEQRPARIPVVIQESMI